MRVEELGLEADSGIVVQQTQGKSGTLNWRRKQDRDAH